MRAVLIGHTMVTDDFFALCDELEYDPTSEEVWEANDASTLAEFAGRLCYKSWKKPNPATASNAGYIANIIDHKHFSVLEHGTVSFYFDGISRNLTHELVRHRHLSFSQVSQRYVDERDAEVIFPAAVADMNWVKAHAVARDAFEAYADLVEQFKAAGISGKKARQAARFILPGGTETAIVVSGNHRSWREFVDKRYSEYADPEIRELAGLVLEQLKALEPSIYADFPEKDFS